MPADDSLRERAIDAALSTGVPTRAHEIANIVDAALSTLLPPEGEVLDHAGKRQLVEQVGWLGDARRLYPIAAKPGPYSYEEAGWQPLYRLLPVEGQ